MKPFSIAIHGGAGTILRSAMTSELEQQYKAVLNEAISSGHEILEKGGTALDAVEKAVIIMEDSHLFNAGKGSVFTAQGKHQMDASIMVGDSLEAGAVSLISGIKNPILLARMVMEKSDHVFLGGEGAEEFARMNNCKFESSDYFYDELRYQQWQEIKDTDGFQLDHSVRKEQKFGTVGAVALDIKGNLAAAT